MGRPVRADGLVSVVVRGTIWFLDRAPVNLGLLIGPEGFVMNRLEKGSLGTPGDRPLLGALVLPGVGLSVGVPLRYVRLHASAGVSWGVANLSYGPDSDGGTPSFDKWKLYYGYVVTAGLDFFITNGFGLTVEYSLSRAAKPVTFSDEDTAVAYTLKGLEFGALTFGVVLSLDGGKK